MLFSFLLYLLLLLQLYSFVPVNENAIVVSRKGIKRGREFFEKKTEEAPKKINYQAACDSINKAQHHLRCIDILRGRASRHDNSLLIARETLALDKHHKKFEQETQNFNLATGLDHKYDSKPFYKQYTEMNQEKFPYQLPSSDKQLTLEKAKPKRKYRPRKRKDVEILDAPPKEKQAESTRQILQVKQELSASATSQSKRPRQSSNTSSRQPRKSKQTNQDPMHGSV